MARYPVGSAASVALNLNATCVIDPKYSTAVSEGVSIPALTDLSGNGNGFAQATAALQPTIVTVNGYRSIRFTKTNTQYMTGAAVSRVVTRTNYSFVGVHQPVTIAAGEALWANSAGFFATQFTTAGGTKINLMSNHGAVDYVPIATATGAMQFFAQRQNDTAESVITNSTAQVAATGIAPSSFSGTIDLANRGGNYFNGHLFFAAWFKRTLSNAELDLLLQACGSEFQLNTTTYL